MSDSTESSREVCCNVNLESCHEHHDCCSDHGHEVHVHVHVHHHCCRAAPVKPDTLPIIRIGYAGPIALGVPGYPNLLTQLKASSNYGPNGIYKKVQSVEFSDATADLGSSSLTVAQLKDKYDVLSVGLYQNGFTAAEVVRLKEHVGLGGFLILMCDHSPTPGVIDVLKQFGHTGNFSAVLSGAYSGVSSTTEILDSYFGSSTGVPLKGHTAIALTATQLPSGSKVFATSGANVLCWKVGGMLDAVFALADVELTTSDVAGIEVATGQAKFLNNLMAGIFDRVLKRP